MTKSKVQVKLAEAEKKRQAAELNMDALKSQTRVRNCLCHEEMPLLSKFIVCHA